jgi:hypothetical protein
MYLNPLRDFVRKFSNHNFRRTRRSTAKSQSRQLPSQYRGQAPFTIAAEVCEARTMLSGPQLVQVQPNVGSVINVAPLANTVENQAPTQLTFTFSPGASINPATFNATSVTVTRAGVDGKLNTADDVSVPVGNYSVDPNNGNLATIRFQDTLPDDLYQIKITGALKDSANAAFNGGVTQLVDFQVDFGAQVVSVVPQPVLRTELINVSPTQIFDGDTFTVTSSGAPVTFQFRNTSTLGAGNISISYTPGATATTLANAMVTAINGSSLAGSFGGAITASSPSAGQVMLTGTAFTPVVTQSSSVLNVADATKITDLDKFTVTAGGKSVTFQFKNATSNSVVGVGNTALIYHTGDTAAMLATEIAAAINGSTLKSSITASAKAGAVTFSGNPALSVTTSKVGFLAAFQGFLTVTDGALSQANDTIDVYFNQDPLVAALAQDPAYYQVISATDGSIIEPTQVTYNSISNTAVLKFASTLPAGTFRLQVGAPKVNNSTTALATNAGAVASNLDLVALAGTTTWNTASATVTGVGSYFTTLSAGQVLQGPDGNFYQIGSISSNNSLTLSSLYFGVAESGFTTYSTLTAGKLAPVAGTTFWTNNSTFVTGVDTKFTELAPGQILQGPDGDLYVIANVGSDTFLTVSALFNGATTPAGPIGATIETLPVGGYGVQGYLGNDTAGQSTDVNSVNLYQFQATAPGIITVNVSNLAAGLVGSGVYLRLFDSTGTVELLNSSTNSFTFINSSSGPTTYYLGVSSAGNTSYDAVLGTGATGGAGFGSYLLNITASNPLTEAADTSSFATAASLGVLGSAGQTISGQIAPLGNLAYPALPGGPGTPGDRDLTAQGVSGESNVGTNSGSSVPGSIPVFYYNFQDVYGVDPFGNVLHNAITDQQKIDAEQIFTMYGKYLGVEFVQTANQGLTVVTGDLRAVDPAISPNGAGGIFGNGEVVMNANIDFGTSPYGGTWFGIAFHEIGHSLGLTHSFDAPSVMGSGVGGATAGEEPPTPGQPNIGSVEQVYPGDIDLVPAENINPADSTDINLYSFTLTTAGTFSAEAIAQRLTLPDTASSDFNTSGGVNVTFSALQPGAAGSGISLAFQYDDLGSSSSAPQISVDGTQISVVLNDDALAATSAEDLVTALNNDPLAGKLIAAQVSGGANTADPGATVIGLSTSLNFTLDLAAPADPSTLNSVLSLYSEASAQATAATSFNTSAGSLASVLFTANAPGTAGNGLSIKFTKSDLGKNAGPSITVSGTTISVVLNTDSIGFTTANSLASAINSNVLSQNLVTASASGVGAGSTNLGSNISSLALSLGGGTGSRTLVARNDDYFGNDSFVNLHLAAGTYYIAVSSVGNTNFDPSVLDSGFGGNTDGKYQLKLSFAADPNNSTTFKDAGINGSGGGVALSGDGVNTTGTAFNYWFQSSTGAVADGGNTIFVDKDNSSDPVQDGSLAHPYSTISTALFAAVPGTIVRIEGNGGGDGNPLTLGDDLSYNIGFDSQNNAASDGSTFVVPQGVTVMIDAGAIIKLHNAVINVGDTVPGIDRSNGSLQVLGTPTDNVVLTSLYNNAIAGTSDPLHLGGPSAGDWGGIIFNQSSDFQGKDSQGNGVFLDSVNQASLSYGGGKVTVDSVPEIVDPIDISNPSGTSAFFARPAVWFNNITLSADSAISADPNSLADTEDRIGPDVYGNEITANSINGFFIRIQTAPGQPIEQLDIAGRITHTDIVYVLAENLLITGNPGGPIEPDPNDPTHTGWSANIAGSLVIDPGVIMKMSGSTIQAQVGGSQLIAEGTASKPIVFTSINDNSYGAGGTFDTSNNANATPAAGDWGGLFFDSNSSGSIDHAVIQYAGGNVAIPGGFAHFNAVEIQQAEVRIANSLFFDNASGDSTFDSDPTRGGLLSNDGATIFVRGAQPVLLDNQFLDNAGYVVSVNANALNDDVVSDWGDSVGALNAIAVNYTNYGPLVAGNTFTGNDVNGMEVRAEEITTQTVWDDTGIVSVVTGAIDDIINQHTFGGIRIQSSASASLVVKLLGANAGFFINGIPLDIDDRIGGALQIIGTSAHPVILTSLNDDTVGAGFQLNGQPQDDTNDDGSLTTAAAGDWNSITLMPYSNDANVQVVLQSGTSISTPASAQFMGTLAPDVSTNTAATPQGGNDYLPLGFDIHGALTQPSDVDVYSFNATAGTEVWFQIGNSSPSLASVLELVDAQGNVLATSDPSKATPGNPYGISSAAGVVALTILKDPTLGGVYYSSNPRDAMMRVILPGTAGTSSTYFIRVRSDSAKTAGAYELQVRLQQQWVTPGSSISYSDVSYATNGIQIEGLPENSILSGTQQSTGTNNSQATAQSLGNLLATNDSTLDAGGTLATAQQVDWYSFTLQYDLIESIAGFNAGGKTLSSIFQVYYTDGLARPDTTLSVFDSTGKLILISRDGGVTSAQPGPGEGNGLTDLTRGSVGALDPFIGSAQLPADTPSGTGFTYYVAISSNAELPSAVSASFGTPSGGILTANGASNLTRLEPVDSVQRIVEDHIGFTGYTTGNPQESNTIEPTTGAILPIDNTADVSQNVVPFTLSDVTLFTSDGKTLDSNDAWTGTENYNITNGLPGNGTSSIKMRSDGTLWEYYGINAAGTIGQIAQIDPGTGAVLQTLGSDLIPNVANPLPNPLDRQQFDGEVNSFVWGPWANSLPGYDGGSHYELFYSVGNGFGDFGSESTSRLYQANPISGSAAVATNTPFGFRGNIDDGTGTIGFTMGMEYVGNQLFGVTSNGDFIAINVNGFGNLATVIKNFNGDGITGFTGLTLGPQNLLNVNGSNATGNTQNILFATTDSGQIVAFDTDGNLQDVFFNSAAADGTDPSTFTTISQGSLGGVTGLAFSPLDINLWHPTTLQATQAGHGVLAAPDNSRNTIVLLPVGSDVDSRNSSERVGGATYYFGLENWVQTPHSGNDYIEYTDANNQIVNGQYGVQTNDNISGATFQQVLTSNDAQSGLGNNYNLPGGAHGSLITDPFSLATYSAEDEPTLYYNYLLQTAGVNSIAVMQDSARVYASIDGGATWEELTTNNLVLSSNITDGELPSYITATAAGNSTDPQSLATVQPTFNTNQWQQARVDLSELAGASSIQLRFDFSTAGTMFTDTGSGNESTGNPGEDTGVGPDDKRTGQNNAFLGFAIDDIIVGFSNRGEMVTGSAVDTSFFGMPQNPATGAPKQALTGAYELEIRAGENYGSLISGISPDIVLEQQFDADQRMISGFTLEVPAGFSINPGDSFTLSDGVNQVTFVFDPAGTVLPTNEQLVAYSTFDDAPTVARSIRDAINAAATAKKFRVTAELSDGLITGTTSLSGIVDTDAAVDLIGADSVTTSALFGANNPGFSNFYEFHGDQLTPRNQGHVEITNNTISFSQQYGISVTPGVRDNGGTPHPDSVINLPTLDSTRQVPGPNIVSNVIDNFGTGGILFSGDNTPGAAAAVPYGRIINNTIYGGATAAGIGVNVLNNAAPSILNNIIANTATGINVDATSLATIVGTSVFKGNTVNLTSFNNLIAATNSIFIAPGAPLFVKPSSAVNTEESGAGFYLAENSAAIDSSLNSLGDRSSMTTVLAPLGLPASPIIAPATDRYGQLRVDDSSVPNATGLGQNIFIDRGAVERADFVGPTAQLVQPLDNGPGDGNSAVGTVFITSPTALTQFAIQISDQGVGVDDTTADLASNYVLTQDGKTLVNGTDYIFVYNANTHVAQFNSASVFSSSSTYTITIAANSIKDFAGNSLQGNQANGSSVFTIIGNAAPTLNSVATQSAIRNITDDITYTQLLNAATPANLGMSIIGGHTPEFLISSIANGTLTITKTSQVGSPTFAVVPGSTISANNSNLVEPGDVLHWNPNSPIFVGTEVGFSVFGYDPTNAMIAPELKQSSFAVPVSFSVVDPTPILTTTTPLQTAALNPAAFPITFQTLVANSDAHTVDAQPLELFITPGAAATKGTVYLDGVAQTPGVGFIMLPTDTLTWVAPAVLPGGPYPVGALVTVDAFTIQAYDAFNKATYNTDFTSTPSVEMSVKVLNVTAPSVVNTAITITHQPQNVPTTITYSQIQSLSGAVVGVAGDTLAFRVESLQIGTFQIVHNGVTSAAYTPAQIATGTVFIQPGDSVIWTAPLGSVNVTLPAFTVSPYDVQNNLDGFVNVAVSVQLENEAPTLTSVAALGLADQQTPFNITYTAFLGASNAADPNGDSIQFRITGKSAQTGNLTITKSGTNTPVAVVVGTTLFAPGDVLTWTGAAGVSGNAISAFTVAAFDGSLTSANTAVPVAINVRALGSAFDLSGTWLVDSPAGTAQGLGRIVQSGPNLTLVNYNGIGSTATYTTASQITAASLDGNANVQGNVDTSAADDGRITWSDGFVWLRVSLGGQWAVTSGSTTTLGSITQNNNLATLINGSTTTNATIGYNASLGQAQLQMPNNTTVALTNDSFTVNGQLWTKLDLLPSYTSSFGGNATSVIQNGTTSLTFVNGQGQTSPGFWMSPTQVVATAFGNEVGTLIPGGEIAWSTGEIWTENTVLNGTKNGSSGVTSITASPSIAVLPTQYSITSYVNSSNSSLKQYFIQNGTNSALFINDANQMAVGTFINPSQLNIAAWGVTATLGAGKITFSSGLSWTQTVLASTSPVVITSYVNLGDTGRRYLVQNGTNMVALLNTTVNLGMMTSATTFTVPDVGLTASFGSGKISFTNGSSWMQTDLGSSLPVTVASYVSTSNPSKSEFFIQNGTSNALFINDAGQMALGTYISPTQINIAAWGLTATVGAGRISFSNNTSWTISFLASSPVTITSYANQSDSAARYLVQNGTSQLAILNTNMVLGTFTSATQFNVPAAGLSGTIAAGQINFTNGSSWFQTSPVASSVTANYYVSPTNGNQGEVFTNGTSVLFVKSDGARAFATLISGTTYNIAAWNMQATFSPGKVTFNNGTSWNQTNSPLPTVTLTDTNGASFKVQVLSKTTIIAFSGSMAGLTATRQNNKLVWSNGTVWNNYDFNALNALFQMAIGYP